MTPTTRRPLALWALPATIVILGAITLNVWGWWAFAALTTAALAAYLDAYLAVIRSIRLNVTLTTRTTP